MAARGPAASAHWQARQQAGLQSKNRDSLMEETTKSNKPLLVGIILLLVFAGLYTFVLFAYQSEGETRKAELSYDADKLEKLDKNRIAADAMAHGGA